MNVHWSCTNSLSGSMLRKWVLTFLSGGSRGLQLFARSWCSSSNLRLMFSMESWSMSQNPARSEATGRGWALGFCQVRTRWSLRPSAAWKIMKKRQTEMLIKHHRLFKIMLPNTLVTLYGLSALAAKSINNFWPQIFRLIITSLNISKFPDESAAWALCSIFHKIHIPGIRA